jgi:hypothetical protein
VTATATDKAGNTTTVTTSFTVVVDCAGMKRLVTDYAGNTDAGTGLQAKLDAACSAPNGNARSGALGAFANQVRAQTGKALTAEQAATLVRLAARL